MTYQNDFSALRRYTRQEVATILNIPDTWLKIWVTADHVPHQRSGKPGPRQRGVWFTHDNIVRIGQMLPDLMSARQANARAESPRTGSAGPADRPEPGSACVGVTDDDLAMFAGLTSLRSL